MRSSWPVAHRPMSHGFSGSLGGTRSTRAIAGICNGRTRFFLLGVDPSGAPEVPSAWPGHPVFARLPSPDCARVTPRDDKLGWDVVISAIPASASSDWTSSAKFAIMPDLSAWTWTSPCLQAVDVSVLGSPWIDGARDIKRRVASGESARVIAGDYERIKEPFIEQMRVGTILAHVRQVAPNRIPGLALKRPRGDEYSSSREPHAWALRNRREYWIRLLRSCSQAERDALAVSARDSVRNALPTTGPLQCLDSSRCQNSRCLRLHDAFAVQQAS